MKPPAVSTTPLVARARRTTDFVLLELEDALVELARDVRLVVPERHRGLHHRAHGGRPRTFGDLVVLDADDAALRVRDQALDARFVAHGDAGLLDAATQRLVEARAREAFALRAVTTRRGLRDVLVGREAFVARVVEVVVVGRIRRLHRTERGVERDALRLEPVEVRDALRDEVAERRLGDDALELELQVLVHRVGAVLDAGLLLDRGSAARVEHAARNRRRAAALEALEHEHAPSTIVRLERGDRAGAAESDDDHVRDVVPLGRIGVRLDDRGRRRGRGLRLRFHRCAPRSGRIRLSRRK